MDTTLGLLSEWKPRKLHFAMQTYFGANFTKLSPPAGRTHSTIFSSGCLQSRCLARKVGPSGQEFQPLPQFQLPAVLAKEGLDLQLAGKSLLAISAVSEPFGQKQGCFPRFCFVPVPHRLLFAGGGSCVTPGVWLLCCFSFLSLHNMVQKGASLPYWFVFWSTQSAIVAASFGGGTSSPSCFLCSQRDQRTP